MTHPTLRILRLALFAGAFFASAAGAAPLTFDFSGSVTDDPFGTSHFGAPISGSFSFDSAALDLIAGAATGGYLSEGADFGFAAMVDGVAYGAAGSLFVGVVDAGSDQYTVTAEGGATTLELLFDDASGTALASDALPTSLSLESFGFRRFRLFGDGTEILGSVDTLSSGGVAAPVPEPETVVLLGAGLLLLKLRRRVLGPLGVAAALLTAMPAFAIDGVTLIDQNKALAGNVTPGDTPGFPITISLPGSYRLAGNLTVADVNTSAIQIAADNVTLDLNGFAISGPLDCSRGCNPSSVGSGIGVRTFPEPGQLPRFGITVRNGTIQGMGSHGIELNGDASVVEHINVRFNGHNGISLIAGFDGAGSTARDSNAVRNGDVGISVTNGVVVSSTSSLNGKTGIVVGSGSASFNYMSDNFGGLVMQSGHYVGNFMTRNLGPAVFGGLNQGQNMCNNSPCPNAVF